MKGGGGRKSSISEMVVMFSVNVSFCVGQYAGWNARRVHASMCIGKWVFVGVCARARP